MFSLPKGNYSPNFLEFFDWSCELFKKHGKKFEIKNTKYILKEGRCGGYCDESGVVLASKAKNFEKNCVHEVAHFLQILEKSPLWTSEDWWNGSFDIAHFAKILNLVALERDCEKRAIKLNRKWNLFDEVDYIKEANAYLYYYGFMFLNKNWNMSPSIYKKEILDLMPNKLVSMSKLRVIDMNLMLKFNTFLQL